MTQAMSKLLDTGKISKLALASSSGALAYWLYLVLKTPRRPAKPAHLFLDKKTTDKKRTEKRRLDYKETLKQLSTILKGVMTFRDVALACGVTVGLILRTLLDLWNIQISTKVESAIITANQEQLRFTLLSFAATMPTLALVNNTIKFFNDKLSLGLRYRISRALYDKYMTELTFYRLSQNPEFQNVDQLLTSDVEKLSGSIVEVYSNLSKPILDIVLLVHRMSSGYTGGSTPALMIGWLAIVGSILTQARRPLSGFIINETQAEGQLRFVHSRLIQNSEEVAFFRGNEREKHTLVSALDSLTEALDGLIMFKFKFGIMENIVGRYASTIVGYLSLALPFFSARYSSSGSEDRLTNYYVSGRMMMKLAESITRVIMAGQDLSRLAAYTKRVHSLLHEIDAASSVGAQSKSGKSHKVVAKDEKRQISQAPVVELCDPEKPVIDFENVTLSTPNGDILVKNLTFTIRPGQSVIISGPNGSGKSSLFRVLGGLWQVESGRVVRPPPNQLFYICQKPYMTLGTLRHQIIFPDLHSRMLDDQLVDILKVVELNYLLEREHSLDTTNDWQDVLSGGEKQRMALARLIYHKPKFAILDECTSAVAIDVEQRIYKHLSQEMNCTLLSVSHRVKQLAKFHHLILEFDGNGSFEFKSLIAPV